MQSIILQRVATTAVMPLVAATGWAGYSYYGPPTQTTCTVITTDVSYGIYGGDVMPLQRFLAARGYLTAMPTGYFGPATRLGLSRFQADEGIPITGIADPMTRQSIQQVSCVTQTAGPAYYPQPDPRQYDSNLSIQGIDAPQSLAIQQQGSWTVHVLGWDSRWGGTLHYSVTWGDEDDGTRHANSDYRSDTVQSTATFTHAYARSGTYTPVFTVTDDYGHRVTARATTAVRSSSYCNGYGGGYDRACGSYSTNNRDYYNRNYYPEYSPGGCTTYYDRACYANGVYIGPDFGSGYPNSRSSDSCYLSHGSWQGNCSGYDRYGYSTGPSYGPYDSGCSYDGGCRY